MSFFRNLIRNIFELKAYCLNKFKKSCSVIFAAEDESLNESSILFGEVLSNSLTELSDSEVVQKRLGEIVV